MAPIVQNEQQSGGDSDGKGDWPRRAVIKDGESRGREDDGNGKDGKMAESEASSSVGRVVGG